MNNQHYIIASLSIYPKTQLCIIALEYKGIKQLHLLSFKNKLCTSVNCWYSNCSSCRRLPLPKKCFTKNMLRNIYFDLTYISHLQLRSCWELAVKKKKKGSEPAESCDFSRCKELVLLYFLCLLINHIDKCQLQCEGDIDLVSCVWLFIPCFNYTPRIKMFCELSKCIAISLGEYLQLLKQALGIHLLFNPCEFNMWCSSVVLCFAH